MSGLTQGPNPKLIAAHGNSTAMDIVRPHSSLHWYGSTWQVPPSWYSHSAELQIPCCVTSTCELGLHPTADAPKSTRRRRESSWLHPFSHPNHQRWAGVCFSTVFPNMWYPAVYKELKKEGGIHCLALFFFFFSLFVLYKTPTWRSSRRP